MNQIRALTNPGDGILAADQIFSASARNDALQSICLSTDGTTNSGVSVGSAVATAQGSSYSLDSLSVLAIEDGGFNAAVAQSHYGPHVFGGGQVFVVSSTTEFANIINLICFPNNKKLVGLEVTQVVQDLKNSVPLISNKRTIVRTYVESSDGNPITASVRLKGTRGGSALPGSPLTPNYNNAPNLLVSNNVVSNRKDLSKTINFEIPTSWTSGTVELEVEGVGGTLVCEEQAGPTIQDCKATISFTTSQELEVKFVRLGFKDQAGTTHKPSSADAKELTSRLLATYPVSSIKETIGSIDLPDLTEPGPNYVNVLTRLNAMRVLDGCGANCSTYYYAFTEQTAPAFGAYRGNPLTWSRTGGIADGIPSKVSLGTKVDGDRYGYNRHGHELAHSIGRRHAVAGCGSGDANAPAFPYINMVNGSNVGTLGPMNDDQTKVFGFDSHNNRVIDPNNVFAMMSYCGNMRWPSKFTYEGLNDELNAAPKPARKSARAPLTTYQVFYGQVDLESNAATFNSVNEVKSSDAPIYTVEPTTYKVEVLDGTGATLATAPVDVVVMETDALLSGFPTADAGKGTFIVRIAKDAAAKKVVLTNNNVVIGQLSASNNAPTVEVVYPNGGENITSDTFTVSWNAGDLDGDANSLFYTVQYSSDTGVTWQTLVVDTQQKTLDVNSSDLTTSNASLIRVIASDGFNTTSDDSDAVFTAANNAPNVTITSPLSNTTYGSVQSITFTAPANDNEDGVIPDGSIVWTSNLVGGQLGTGASFNLLASSLPEGVHTITVTATDSLGATKTDSILLRIVRVFGAGATITTVPTPVTALITGAGSIGEGKYVILDAADSSGDDLTYFWSQISGPDAGIYNTANVRIAFDAPDVSKTENLEFRLTVTDVFGVTVSKVITVTVLDSNGSGGSDSTTTVTVSSDGKKGSSFGWIIALLFGGLFIRRKTS